MPIRFFAATLFVVVGFSAHAAEDRFVDDQQGCKIHQPSAPGPTWGDRLTWSGGCKNGYANGEGLLQSYSNGEPGPWFKGSLVHGKMDGVGSLHYPLGNWYEGNFHNGQVSGSGVWHFVGQGRYQGEFRDGMPIGRAIYFYENGNRYEGEFTLGSVDGKGTIYYANGSRYEGEFYFGKFKGKGTLFASGKSFEIDEDGRLVSRSDAPTAIGSATNAAGADDASSNLHSAPQTPVAQWAQQHNLIAYSYWVCQFESVSPPIWGGGTNPHKYADRQTFYLYFLPDVFAANIQNLSADAKTTSLSSGHFHTWGAVAGRAEGDTSRYTLTNVDGSAFISNGASGIWTEENRGVVKFKTQGIDNIEGGGTVTLTESAFYGTFRATDDNANGAGGNRPINAGNFACKLHGYGETP